MPITRRTLLVAASAVPLASLASVKTVKSILKPKALRDGDTISIISPSSSVQGPADLEKARRNVESLGFKVKTGAHASDSWGYLAGTDEHRAADINDAFEDSEVSGIICVKGGYGAARLLDRLNYDAIHRNPKVLLGYSDITALILAIYAKAGVVTFHGPVALSTYSAFDLQNITKTIRTAEPAGLLAVPSTPEGHPPQPLAATLSPGKARGRLIGGNLSLVASLVGSPYLPSFAGHILFLEDIGEEPYRIDRMLNTLRISGAMKGVQGLVFGDFSLRATQSAEPATSPEREFTMLHVLQNFADQIRVPAFCGAWIGHIKDKDTLPVGVQAELDAEARTLTIVESAVTTR